MFWLLAVHQFFTTAGQRLGLPPQRSLRDQKKNGKMRAAFAGTPVCSEGGTAIKGKRTESWCALRHSRIVFAWVDLVAVVIEEPSTDHLVRLPAKGKPE